MTPRARLLVAAAAALAAAAGAVGGASAASTVFWRVSTQEEFLRGTADNVSIDAGGRLLPGPNAEQVVESGVPFLWSLARAGGDMWVGGGSPGALYRATPGGEVTTVLDGAAGDVQALVAGPGGEVFAATSPDGGIAAFDARGGRREVFDPGEPYVWALAAAADGTLYAGTGNPGRIYRIPPGGDAALLYDTGAAHVRALAVDAAGRLVAGTGSPGRVLRIDEAGRAFVLVDTNHDEITSIRLAPDGAVLALAAGGAPAPVSAGPPAAAVSAAAPAVTASTTVTVTASVSAAPAPAVPAAGSAAPSGAAGGAVYRIAPDGLWDVVWQSTADTPYDAALDGDGRLIVGTGPDGKIFRVEGRPRTTVLLARAAARQVTRFAAGPDGRLYYATANPGRLHRLATDRAGRGVYVSEAHDARTVATWGANPLAGGHAGRQLGPPADPLGQHRRPGRDVEPVVGVLRRPVRDGHRQPQRAVPPVAGAVRRRRRRAGPLLGHRRLSAPQPRARGHAGHGPSSRKGQSAGLPRRPADRRAGRRARPRGPAARGGDRADAGRRPAGVPQGAAVVRLGGARPRTATRCGSRSATARRPPPNGGC